MPVNDQILVGAIPQPVPPDRECVRNGTEILALVAEFMQFLVQQAQINSGSDSVAQQALETANIALATAQQALAAAPNVRSSGGPVAIPTGDTSFAISWSPAFPSTDYIVLINYEGTNAAVGAFYAFRVVETSKTVNGVTLKFDNTPAAGDAINWLVWHIGS